MTTFRKAKKNYLSGELEEGDFEFLLDYFGFSLEEAKIGKKFLKIYFFKDRRIYSYLSRVGIENFSFSGFRRYSKFRDKFPNLRGEEYYKALFGRHLWKEKYETYCSKIGESGTLEGYIKKFGEEEGTKKYNERISNISKARSLEGQIEKLGEEEGRKRWKEICENTSYSQTLDGLKEKYGEKEGEKIFKKRQESNRKNNNLEGYIERYGEKEGIKLYEEKNARVGFSGTLDGFIERYGEKEGTERFELQLARVKHGRTLEGHIERFGEEEGTKIYEEALKRRSFSQTLEGYIERHGKRKGTKIYEEKCERASYTQSLEWYIERFGEEGQTLHYKKNYHKKIVGKTDDEIVELMKEDLAYKEIIKNSTVLKGQASLESLVLFIPLKERLKKEFRLKHEDIVMGYGNQVEFKLQSEEGRFFYYDFTIEKYKLIIEYDGENIHPDHSLTEKELKKWKNCFGFDGLSIFRFDKAKEKIAEDNGYKVIRVRNNTRKELERLFLKIKKHYEENFQCLLC